MKMNIYPSFADIRNHLHHKFFTLRTNARRDLLWAKLMGKTIELATFPEEAPEKSPNRRYNGTGDILVEQIVGTLNRQKDFDHKFRPLNKHLVERWVNVYLSMERDGWPPILVHRVGESYFVEDGHHRVSIAQALGMKYIPARVWDYPPQREYVQPCQPEPCPEMSTVPVYAGMTD
jgi:hypothetical protein